MVFAGVPSGSAADRRQEGGAGGNLASQFTPEVIRAAQQNNVYLCDLPSAVRDGD